MEPGAAVYEIGSGSYAFRSKDAKKVLATGRPAGE
jgi:hypothetical protein